MHIVHIMMQNNIFFWGGMFHMPKSLLCITVKVAALLAIADGTIATR